MSKQLHIKGKIEEAQKAESKKSQPLTEAAALPDKPKSNKSTIPFHSKGILAACDT